MNAEIFSAKAGYIGILVSPHSNYIGDMDVCAFRVLVFGNGSDISKD